MCRHCWLNRLGFFDHIGHMVLLITDYFMAVPRWQEKALKLTSWMRKNLMTTDWGIGIKNQTYLMYSSTASEAGYNSRTAYNVTIANNEYYQLKVNAQKTYYIRLAIWNLNQPHQLLLLYQFISRWLISLSVLLVKMLIMPWCHIKFFCFTTNYV